MSVLQYLPWDDRERDRALTGNSLIVAAVAVFLLCSLLAECIISYLAESGRVILSLILRSYYYKWTLLSPL